LTTKVMLTGNEAVARGAWEAGVGLGIGYPGTPSTEILEALSLKEGPQVCWAVNEKVALEEAYGAAVGGLRVMVTMKHVGLNVAADPLFIAAYLGVNGGLVIAVADDPGMHSSQNEQDNRWYALHAKVPMLEPADSEECLRFTKLAFELSERYDVPVLLRLVTRTSHAGGLVLLNEEVKYNRVKHDYVPSSKYVTLPGNCRARKKVLEQNLKAIVDDESVKALDLMEITSPEVGIITSGASYNYVKEVFGDSCSVLKLGLVYPLNASRIREFAGRVKKLFVVEELDPYLENNIKAMGIGCEGKQYITSFYELNPQIVAASLADTDLNLPRLQAGTRGEPAAPGPLAGVPARPPLLCAGCPHRGFFYLAKKAKLMMTGDIGCYSLGAMPPLEAFEASICMGGGYTMAQGLSLTVPEGQKVFGVMGDSTFFHSGITGALEGIYNNRAFVPVVLDNRITAMTGHQQNPGTGRMMDGTPTLMQEPAVLFKALGYDPVMQVGAYDLDAILSAIQTARIAAGKAAIVVKAPCRLIRGVEGGARRAVNQNQCHDCKRCLKLGCPAISLGEDGKPVIDAFGCFGCGVCQQVCKHESIYEVAEVRS